MKDVPRYRYNESNIAGINQGKKWWKTDPDKVHESVWSAVNYIKQNQEMRHRINNIARKLYENDFWKETASVRNVMDEMSDRLNRQVSFNIIKSCVDTARAKIAKTKPRPFFLTDNGDWHLQQKAKKLNRFVLGLFDNMGGDNGLVRDSLYRIGSEVFFDACLSGTGAAKLMIRDGKIVAERFFSDEIIVDSFEGMYRRPRSLHHLKYVDRDVLKAAYPGARFASYIDRVTADGLSMTQDMIPVIESFHLPSGPKSKDGIRTVTIKTGTLHHTTWDKGYFPVLIQRWNLRPVGFFGIGLAEELYGLQCEISRTLRSIQLGIRRIAVPRVFRHIADHNDRKLKNIIGEIHYYNEKPPIFMTPSAFSAETYNYLEMLYQKAFELCGISQLSAQAQKPAGLDSGAALRNFQDIESERFSDVHLMYENFFTPQATYMSLDFCEELHKAGTDIVVQAKDGVTLQPIKYSDVRLPQDSFTVRAYPTAFLPTEPSGRLAKVQDLVRIGMYDQEEARELLDFPDLSKINKIKAAPRSSCISYIENIIETGEYMPIEPYQNLELTQTLAQSYYLDGRSNNMPQDRLDLLRRVLTEVKNKLDEIRKLQMQMQQAPMAGPQLVPADQNVLGPQMPMGA